MTATFRPGDRVVRKGFSMVGIVLAVDDARRAKSNTNGGVPMARVEWSSGSTSRVTVSVLRPAP
jgi:hypothetical protein